MRQNPQENPKLLSGVVPSRNVEVPYAGYQSGYGEDQGGDGVLEYWKILRRHKGAVLLAAFLGGLAGFLYTLPQTPIYQASATLEVQGLNENFLNMRDVNPTTTGNSWDPSYD